MAEVEEDPFDVSPDALTLAFPEPAERAWFIEVVTEAVQANDTVYRRFRDSRRWRSPSFELMRRLKQEPRIRGLPAEEAARLVTVALGEIFDQDKEEFLWESVIGHNDSDGQQLDPFTDFLYGWDAWRGGSGVLEEAVNTAKTAPRPPGYFGSAYAGVNYRAFRVFLTIAERLQEGAGDELIFLSVNRLAELLNTAQEQVTRWRNLGKKYGFLEEVTPSGPGRCTEFRFHLPPLPPDRR